MALAIAYKTGEGIVLAADRRITINNQRENTLGPKLLISSHYDGGSRLFKTEYQDHVAAVNFGYGTILTRPLLAYFPEFEREIADEGRLPVETFARKLGEFYQKLWKRLMPADFRDEAYFLVGGYDEDAPYGRIFQISVPSNAQPVEYYPGEFGMQWGGRAEIASRILAGLDPVISDGIKQHLRISDQQSTDLYNHVRTQLNLKVPYPSLPLGDCIGLSELIIRTTADFMKYSADVRDVSGLMDIATITRAEGFRLLTKE